jgi:hypothetical protein
MAEIDVFVWHDNDGNITAVGAPHPDMVGRVRPVAAADRGVLQTKIDESYIDRLHEIYRIDIKCQALAPRGSTKD